MVCMKAIVRLALAVCMLVAVCAAAGPAPENLKSSEQVQRVDGELGRYGGRLVIGDYAGRIWALSARTGATRWVRSVNGRVYGTSAVAHGRVFRPESSPPK